MSHFNTLLSAKNAGSAAVSVVMVPGHGGPFRARVLDVEQDAASLLLADGARRLVRLAFVQSVTVE